MSLTDFENEELKGLRERFGSASSIVISTGPNLVMEQTFSPDLVEEDERYDYPGKLDDSAPGIRYNVLGTIKEYRRYKELERRLAEK